VARTASHCAHDGCGGRGNPNAYVQAKAGHSQFSITERYVHAAQVAFPGAADRSEERLFGSDSAGQGDVDRVDPVARIAVDARDAVLGEALED
jgi:hypothetical protein